MFEKIATLLMRGEFICEVAYPQEFKYLSDKDNLDDIEQFFSRIDRRIARTSEGAGYFLAYRSYEANQSTIKSQFATIKHSIRPAIDFFNIIMRATGDEMILSSGTIIQADTLIGKIDQDASLRSSLQSLGAILKIAQADGTQAKLFASILKKMDGYIVLTHPERSIYQVTGKIEYLHDTIALIMESEGISVAEEEEEENPQNGMLL